MVSRRDKVFADLASGTLAWGSTFSEHMLVYSHNGHSWSSGVIQKFQPLPLHPASSILHYGTGVFEGAKAYSGPSSSDPPQLFRPQAHLARLKRGCMRMALPEPPEDLLERLCELVEKEAGWVPKREIGSLYLRIAIVGMGESVGVYRPHGALCYVICSPVGGYFSGNGMKRKGLRLWAEKKYFRAMRGGVGAVKAGGNYGSAMLPAEKAREMGYDQILWLSDAREMYVTEAGMMNFVVVLKNGDIWTPPADDLILPGVTRMSIIELIKEKLGKVVQEKVFTIELLCDMIDKGEVSEMMGTGTGAIASTVSTIGFNGKDYTVPDVPENDSVVTWIKTSLSEIHGTSDHRWMVPVRIR